MQSRSRPQWRNNMSVFFQIISSKLRNIFVAKPGMLRNIISQSVMQKNWFTVFNVMFTLRAYIIKIWLYLLYLLNCWSVCNLTWFDKYSIISQSVLRKNGITAFNVKVTAKVRNVSDCLFGWYFLSHRIFCCQIWYGDASSWARVSCGFFVVVAIFNVKVIARAHMIKIWLFLLYILNCWFLGNQTWSDDTSS